MKSEIKYRYFLPYDITNFSRLDELIANAENVSLLFSKYIKFYSNDKNSNIHSTNLKNIYEIFRKNTKFGTIRNIYKIFFNLIHELYSSHLRFTLKTKSSLIVGLGDESVYETSIRLNRNYGVPYIPGSALKGIAKHWAILKLAESEARKNTDKDFYSIAKNFQNELESGNVEKYGGLSIIVNDGNKLIEIKFEELIDIFGTQKYKGKIIFFDAFPHPKNFTLRGDFFKLDIMNPHYFKYYSAKSDDLSKDENAPGDWHEPKPIFFLTVPENIEFVFAIGILEDKNDELLNKAKALLIEALREHGVGAKTAIGYGRFHDLSRQSPQK